MLTDWPEVADQLAGRSEIPVELIGLYLQTRALLNAYRGSTLVALPRERNVEAALAAIEALDQGIPIASTDLDDADDLPLFSSALTDA